MHQSFDIWNNSDMMHVSVSLLFGIHYSKCNDVRSLPLILLIKELDSLLLPFGEICRLLIEALLVIWGGTITWPAWSFGHISWHNFLLTHLRSECVFHHFHSLDPFLIVVKHRAIWRLGPRDAQPRLCAYCVHSVSLFEDDWIVRLWTDYLEALFDLFLLIFYILIAIGHI